MNLEFCKYKFENLQGEKHYHLVATYENHQKHFCAEPKEMARLGFGGELVERTRTDNKKKCCWTGVKPVGKWKTVDYTKNQLKQAQNWVEKTAKNLPQKINKNLLTRDILELVEKAESLPKMTEGFQKELKNSGFSFVTWYTSKKNPAIISKEIQIRNENELFFGVCSDSYGGYRRNRAWTKRIDY